MTEEKIETIRKSNSVTQPSSIDYTGDCVIPERYKNFRFDWTGWMRLPHMDGSAGQWLAASMTTNPIRTFYASYPGGEGEFQRGDHFDIGIRVGQEAPAWNDLAGKTFTPETWPYRIGLNDAFKRLIELLDSVFGDGGL